MMPSDIHRSRHHLVTKCHCRFGDAQPKRLQGEDAEAAHRLVGEQALVAGMVTEILADHPAVIERMSVIGDQAGNSAQRIVAGDLGMRFDRRDGT